MPVGGRGMWNVVNETNRVYALARGDDGRSVACKLSSIQVGAGQVRSAFQFQFPAVSDAQPVRYAAQLV